MQKTRYAIVLNTGLTHEFENASPETQRPQKDYMLLADSLNATLIFPEASDSGFGAWRKRFGAFVAQAWHAYRRRDEYDVVLTMSEQVGLVLALLFKITRCNKTHIMISHYLTPFRKNMFLRLFHVQSHIDKFICYGSAQRSFLIETLKVHPDKVEMVLHPADANFWKPASLSEPESGIVSAGMLARDYETLFSAVADLDVDVTVAAASPWTGDKRCASDGTNSDRVKFVRCSPAEMRELYAHSLFVVVPLLPVNIQAGSLVIYEAMAMGKAVVTSDNGGNLDIVEDGVTGCYVPFGDHRALRNTVAYLLEHPDAAKAMGVEARKVVERELNLGNYIRRVTEIVTTASGHSGHALNPTTSSGGISNTIDLIPKSRP